MAEQTSLVQEGVDRLNDAFHSIDHEFQRVQKELNARRRSVEKQLSSTRKNVEKRTRKELNRLQSELKKSPLVKRAKSLQKDLTKEVEASVDTFLGLIRVASKADVARIDKKLTTLNRHLKAMEKARKTNGTSPSL
jgi:TolA-binding protein